MSLVCYPVFFVFYNMENCLEKFLLFHYGYIIKSRHVCTYKKAVAIASKSNGYCQKLYDEKLISQCKIVNTSSRRISPSLIELFFTPFDLASAYRISPMICMVFTPEYLFIAAI